MSETRERKRISNGTVADATLTTKFFMSDDSEVLRTLDTATLSNTIQSRLCAYGANAAAKAQYHGVVQTAEEALSLYDEFILRLQNGTWEPGRQGGDSGPSELVLAVMRVSGRAQYDCEEAIDPLKPEEKRALRNDPAVASAIADIRTERARELKKAAKGKPSVMGRLFGPSAQAAE